MGEIRTVNRVVTGSSPVGGAKPQFSASCGGAIEINSSQTHDFHLRCVEVRRACGVSRSSSRIDPLTQCGAEGSVEGLCCAAVGESPAEVVVLRHGHLGVPQLVGDLSGRQLALVEEGGAGLAEHVAGHPGELATATRLT